MILIYLSILFLSLYILLILNYAYAWSKIPYFHPGDDFKPSTSISIIVPARNEEKNIAACLHSLARLDYPEELLEIIVINDFSTDQTESIIRSFHLPYLKLINMADAPSGATNEKAAKKRAIEAGISRAGGGLIVTTDADCIFHHNWLKVIAAFYESRHPVFIASPVALMGRTDLLDIFQVLDFLSLQGITAASVHRKFHPMCNGANLAYERKVFYEVDGFTGIDHIASGDDMLLMGKINRLYPDRVLYLKNREAIVQTQPAQTLTEFVNQRIRWSSKATQYKEPRIFLVLLLVYALNLLFFLLMIYSFFQPAYWKYLAILILIKWMVELVFMIPVASFFHRIKTLWFFLPAQPFHVIYTVMAGFFGQTGGYEWKGRRVK